MSIYDDKSFAAANTEYAKAFTEDLSTLPLRPKKRYAIITCMDARIDTSKAFGIPLGDAHVIRNAGGNASESLRSLVISQQLLGTNAIFLVKHTDCGMATFTKKQLDTIIKTNLGVSAEHINFRPFSDLKQAVIDDVALLKGHELISPAVKDHISGWIYHVETGEVENVVAAGRFKRV